MKVDLYHNIRWARYKARVLSAVYKQTIGSGIEVRFTQIADTADERKLLSGVEMVYHQYPHELLFPGSYEDVPILKLVFVLFARVFRSNANLVLIPGYDRPEYWAMLAATILTGKRRGVFCDSTLNDKPQKRLKGLLKRLFFAACDLYFAYGERSAQMLLHYGAKPDRLYYPIQAAALPDNYRVEEAFSSRINNAVNSGAPRFIYVGRLATEKALHTLLHAFWLVLIELPGATLELVGSGPLEDELYSLTSKIGLEASVIFSGSLGQEGLSEVYSRSTCLILPSRSEPWGLVVNESLHYGCPVIVSDRCGCVPDLVVEGVTGFSFKTGDVGELAEKMVTVATTFTDHGQVAARCIELISNFTPEAAAYQVLQGCRSFFPES